MTEQYYQCRMEREPSPGTVTVTTGWIAARAAKVGAQVELLPSGQFWKVAEVFNKLPADVLKRHQLSNRKSLPSIEAIT